MLAESPHKKRAPRLKSCGLHPDNNLPERRRFSAYPGDWRSPRSSYRSRTLSWCRSFLSWALSWQFARIGKRCASRKDGSSVPAVRSPLLYHPVQSSGRYGRFVDTAARPLSSLPKVASSLERKASLERLLRVCYACRGHFPANLLKSVPNSHGGDQFIRRSGEISIAVDSFKRAMKKIMASTQG